MPSPNMPILQLAQAIVEGCDNCGETREIAKVKGCLRCLRCGWKHDCNGF